MEISFFFVSIIVLLNLTFKHWLNKGFIDEYSSNDKKILKN